MFANALKVFKSSTNKTHDDTKIQSYTTLINFYLQNGYQAEALLTLEQLAHYYYDTGLNGDATKVLQLVTRINPTYNIGKFRADRLNKGIV